MLVVSGIVMRKGRVLLLQRSALMSQSGKWEFPAFEVTEDETMEDCLERNIFDCLSVQVIGAETCGALPMVKLPFVRFFLYRVEIRGNVKLCAAYSRCKWLKIKELWRFRLSLAGVTAINGLQKL